MKIFYSFVLKIFLFKKLTTQNSKNATILATTMLAPVGVSYKKEAVIPTTKHKTESTAEQRTTVLKVLQRRIEVSDGKIIRLEISNVPIMRIPTTMVRAVSSAIIKLYTFALVPVAFAKFSSNVTAKIL